MGFLAVVEQGARAYPALLPLVLVSIALTLWAYENKRWLWATVTGLLGCAVCVLYIGSPAGAADRSLEAGMHAGVGGAGASVTGRTGDPRTAATGQGTGRAGRPLLEPGRFSSSVRLHPRFPSDFPIPRSFRLESNSGGARSGNVTVRFRFTDEAANAVCDLREQGRANGWTVEILAPHRLVFHKNARVVEAWFSYPAHSVVLDIPDNQ
jgi:hypothetical protein